MSERVYDARTGEFVGLCVGAVVNPQYMLSIVVRTPDGRAVTLCASVARFEPLGPESAAVLRAAGE